MGLCSARVERVIASSWLRVALVAWALCLTLASPARAQTPSPPDPQFQVNTYTTSPQGRASVAAQANGDFVVVWQSYGSAGTDSSYFSVQGQRYDRAGFPVGDEFQVNTYTMNGQGYPSVGAAADGDFVVVWTSNGSAGTDSSSLSVQGQRYDSAGARVGGEFQVNTYTTGSQGNSDEDSIDGPSVAVEPDGDFVVVWQSDGSAETDSSDLSIQGQRYDSAGVPVGGEFQVNNFTTSKQYLASVAAEADGDFVVVWTSAGSAGSDSASYSVQGQRYDSAGAPLGGEFQVNTFTTSGQGRPSVAAEADGDFVVVWTSAGSAGSDSASYSVQGQRYDSAGAPVGDEFQVNSYTGGPQGDPSVSALADGDFVVAWVSDGSAGTDSDDFSVQGQRYDSAGAPVEGEFQVNSYTRGLQGNPSVAAQMDGAFVVVWESDGSYGTDSSYGSVQARLSPLVGDSFVDKGTGDANTSFVGVDTDSDQMCVAGKVEEFDRTATPFNRSVTFTYRSLGSISKATAKKVQGDFVSVILRLEIIDLVPAAPVREYYQEIMADCTLEASLRTDGSRDKVKLRCELGEDLSAFPGLTPDLLENIDNASLKRVKVDTKKGKLSISQAGVPADGAVPVSCRLLPG